MTAKNASTYFYYLVETDGGPLEIVARDETEVFAAVTGYPLGYPPPFSVERLREATAAEIALAKRSYLPSER